MQQVDLLHTLSGSLASPMVLAFVLGVLATLLKSDLKFPEGMYMGLTIYLLFAIGLKGGVKLSHTPLIDFLMPGAASVIMCCIIPVLTYVILHHLAKFDAVNAAAMSAHFGSVSAVTFSQSITYAENAGIAFEGFMPALLAIMEVPGVFIALYIARKKMAADHENNEVMRELLTGKGIILLIGGILIGLFSGDKGYESVAPLFDAPFKGILCLFLLEVGLVTGRRVGDLRKVGLRLIAFSLLIVGINALLGSLVAALCGLSVGGIGIFTVLCASASYIAAPAAIRIALPEANPGYYLTAALAIVFPFNVIVGIPLYFKLATYIHPLITAL